MLLMPDGSDTERRRFLKLVGTAGSAAFAGRAEQATAQEKGAVLTDKRNGPESRIAYPRVFTGRALTMLSFPLGGIGAGSIGLGGRGQLRDWEIVNRADKGHSPDYALPSIWVKAAGRKPIARVLEARLQPPYEGQNGLGSANSPGLSRLEGATFTGEFPQAHISFQDRGLPVTVALEAGTPFFPLQADESGLPIAVLRYRVKNSSAKPASVSIAYSIDNPVLSLEPENQKTSRNGRVNESREGAGLTGLLMHNPQVQPGDAGFGTFALCLLGVGDGRVSTLHGWPAGRWWNSPLLFWDDFSADGELGPEAEQRNSVGALCLKREIPAGGEAEYTFLLAWHFPNRTPERCGWHAPKGHEKDVIGNYYATRFKDAWEAAEYAAAHLETLERRTRQFTSAIRQTTTPPAIKEAAMANLSTLVSTTCFRTADGEFHGFEGVNDKLGCCYGNCTHVWNYEAATAYLFPSLSRSLRRAAFGFSMDDRGALYFRQSLPDGIARDGFVAADGQMGQIIKIYLDWQLSGDETFLHEFWPKAKRALEFCWVPGGWDADRDGVMEGVQHNTYDVEFYGPNPLCGIYYLGALRAGEEMARAVGDTQSASEYRRLFENGSRWLDTNLFNGEYYVQKVRGFPADKIAPGLRSGMGADDPEHPQYQVGDGCLVDQLLGQYLADIAGLGPLVDSAKIRRTLQSIYRYNHKPALFYHDCVQRTFALNDEAAMVICDYGKGKRPKIPFPYYAEVMTGFEHSAAALMMYTGMIREGVECVSDIRRRYDGIRRNPWDEAECGHHYARAMASWSGLVALSGFAYRGAERSVTVRPRWRERPFRSFWSMGTGWGLFSLAGNRLTLSVSAGNLPVSRIAFLTAGNVRSAVRWSGKDVKHNVEYRQGLASFRLTEEIRIEEGQELILET
jgi:non-lysosomal glucosylceramidase